MGGPLTLPKAGAAFLSVFVVFLFATELARGPFSASSGDPAFSPANGVTLAALVVLGCWYWPWVLSASILAELVTSLDHGYTLGWASYFATADSLEVLVGASLFLRWAPGSNLSGRRGFFAFVGAALGIGPLVGAALGAAALAMKGDSDWAVTIFYWWTGDVIGILVVGATLVAWWPDRSTPTRRPLVEWLGTLSAMALASLAPLVLGARPVLILPLLPMMWAAARLGVRGTLTTAVVLAIIGDLLTVNGVGSWAAASGSSMAAVGYLQLSIAITTLSAWLLAVEVQGRERAENAEAAEREGRRTAEELAHRLARLRRLAESLSRATTPDAITAAWANEAPAVLGGRKHELYVLHPDGDRLVLGSADYATSGSRGPESGTTSVDLGSGSTVARSATTGTVVVGGAAVPGDDVTIAAPMAVDGRLLGVIAVTCGPTSRDDPAVRETVVAAADRVAEALLRARLFTEAVDAEQRLARLQTLTSRLARGTSTDDVVTTVLEDVRVAFGATAAGVALPDQGGRTLRVRGAVGVPSPGLGLDDGQTLAGAMVGPGAVMDAASVRAPRYGPMRHPALDRVAPGGERPVVDAARPGTRTSSWMVLPLVAGTSRLVGVTWFCWSAPREVTVEDRAFHTAVTEQCATALRRALGTESEHEAAIKLQQALLPRSFPQVAGMSAAARYVPSTEALSVGGDWYDVVARPGGRGVVVVGDVVGHDAAAAAAMGQLRSALAAIAVDSADPGAALEQLDTFPGGPAIGFATAVYAEFDPGEQILRYACAGHPPPLLVKPSGEAVFLVEGRSAPLFALPPTAAPPRRGSGAVRVPAGSLLVCYTDGLVERPECSLYEGMADLARACLRHRGRTLADFSDRVLSHMTTGRVLSDDVAMLCVSLQGAPDRALVPEARLSSAAS